MTPGLVRIPAALLAAIADQAQAAYPGECCGLLAGFKDVDGAVTITRIQPSPNTAQPPAPDRFEVDPQVRFDLMRELDGTGVDIVGHYHSHPDHPAEPSATDIDMAFEPDLIWLIIPVVAGTPGEPQAWRLNRETGTVESWDLEPLRPSRP